MENSSIQPRDVLADFASVKERVQGLSNDDFSALCDGVVTYIFTTRLGASSIAPHFAAFFRHAADRDPAIARDIAATKMAAYTNQEGPHYKEEHEEYLINLSKELHTNPDYRAAFDKISEATRSGKLPPSKVPEVPPLEDATPEN